MSRALNFYQTLDEPIYSKLGVKVSYAFSYFDGTANNVISFEDTARRIGFDPNTGWNSFEYDLKLKVTVHIKDTTPLFGYNGLAPKNSKLGLCLEWYSQKDKRRNVVLPQSNIQCTSSGSDIEFDVVFPKNYFKNNINVNLSLYLMEAASELLPGEDNLNNDPGILLGNIDEKEIFITGQGSLFPLFLQPNANDKKLWRVEINIEEPETDKLSDCVKVIINTAHKDYNLTNSKDPNYCDRLVNEIIANALSILFNNLKQSEERYLDHLDKKYADGTILYYAQYCKNVLNIDFEDAITISDTIREYLEGVDD